MAKTAPSPCRSSLSSRTCSERPASKKNPRLGSPPMLPRTLWWGGSRTSKARAMVPDFLTSDHSLSSWWWSCPS